MTRLYKEMPKGEYSENGVVLFGTEQQAQPGEAHGLEAFAWARSRMQQQAELDPNFDFSKVEGLGAMRDFGVYTTAQDANVQRSFFRVRDQAAMTRSNLPPILQRFAQGLVRPEPRSIGYQPTLNESAVGRMSSRGQLARLRIDPGRAEGRSTGVTNLGDLEPRMNAWGDPLHDEQRQWFSPPGTRTLRHDQEIVATQGGDLSGIADSYAIFPTQSEALKKGYGQLFYQGGAIGITTPHGPITIVDTETVYPTMQAALQRGYGFMYQSGSQVVVSGPAGPTPINSQKIAAPPAPTPVSQLAPPPPRPGGVFVPPPPAPTQQGTLPALPSGGGATNVNAPTVPVGTIVQTPQGPAVTTAGGGLATVTDASGNGGSVATDASGNPLPAALPPQGALSFLTAPVTLPLVGSVPTWGLLAGGVAVIYLARRRRASYEAPRTNPKKKGKKKR